MPVSLLLVDDNAVFREGLRGFLESQPEFEVIADTGNGSQALLLAIDLLPDVVLLDWHMPGVSGLAVLCWLAQHQKNTRIIILSMHSDEAYIDIAIQNGARGYVLKDDIVDHLPGAIRAVMANQKYLSHAIIQQKASESCMITRAAGAGFAQYQSSNNS